MIFKSKYSFLATISFRYSWQCHAFLLTQFLEALFLTVFCNLRRIIFLVEHFSFYFSFVLFKQGRRTKKKEDFLENALFFS